jgi:hypothetical protein
MRACPYCASRIPDVAIVVRLVALTLLLAVAIVALLYAYRAFR